LDGERNAQRIVRLARLGRQRDFSHARFKKQLASLARPEERAEVLRELLTEWTGLPHSAREAAERWTEIEGLTADLRISLGAPVSLQTVLLHYFHSVTGLLKEPRILSGRDLSVLRVNAITDPLTGLYNRRFLMDHLNREIARADRSDGIMSIVLLDLKGFKAVNDHFGHPVGDTVLVKTARIMRLSPVDTALRVTLPAAGPYIVTGIKLAVAYAFIGVIGSEFIMSRGGIGYEINFAYTSFDNATMYPLIVLILLASVAVNAGLSRWEQRLLARRGMR